MSSDNRKSEVSDFSVNCNDELSENLSDLIQKTFIGISSFVQQCDKEDSNLNSSYLRESAGLAYKSIFKLIAVLLRDPILIYTEQLRLLADYVALFNNALSSSSGKTVTPVATPDSSDKRFEDSEWTSDKRYDLIKQFYLITVRWIKNLVNNAKNVDEKTRLRADFYIDQLLYAMAPSNFVLTNPELLRVTINDNAKNLANGSAKLLEDIQRGNGNLKIRQSKLGGFELGVDIANTPGLVVSQNDICQIIRYEPLNGPTLKRPLLIVPPWINKFYILDLTQQKSFVQWSIRRGHAVFLISWVNPTGEKTTSFEDYMQSAIFYALEVIEAATGEKEVNALGYCIGGTLLATALAYSARIGDQRLRSASLLTTQIDFADDGIIGSLIDEDQIKLIESITSKKGYLDGHKLGMVFNMLRPNELIWPFFIKNYLLGKEPSSFDILHWNSDCTRIPAENHSFYLRNCYLNNNLANGRMEIFGDKVKLSDSSVPIYLLATRTDHIVPASAVYRGRTCFGGPVEFVLGDSGHIAGVINSPAKNRYRYWSSGPSAENLDQWLSEAKTTQGSWWPHWHQWVAGLDKRMTEGRLEAYKNSKYIEEAPGSYVKVCY